MSLFILFDNNNKYDVVELIIVSMYNNNVRRNTIQLESCMLKTKQLANTNVIVQGGIALTSPPCHEKQTSGLTKNVRSVYQTNGEMAVVKAAL